MKSDAYLDFECRGSFARRVLYHAQRLQTNRRSGLEEVFARTVAYGAVVALQASIPNTTFFLDADLSKDSAVNFPLIPQISRDYTAGFRISVPAEIRKIVGLDELEDGQVTAFGYTLNPCEQTIDRLVTLNRQNSFLDDDTILMETLFQLYEVIWEKVNMGKSIAYRKTPGDVQKIKLDGMHYV